MVETGSFGYNTAHREVGFPSDLRVTNILHDEIATELKLKRTSKQVRRSISESQWARINGGSMVLEVRTLSFLQQPTLGSVNIFDFDDCLFSATSWHKKEYELVEKSEILREQGINISAERAKDIYELSKIQVPGIAEKERRYTPELNLILLSTYASIQKQVQLGDVSEDDAWSLVLKQHETVLDKVAKFGDRGLSGNLINPTIQAIFEDNTTSEFVYKDFVEDALEHSGKADLRIIATRGKIEGHFGQIYKVHSSGIMELTSNGSMFDLVVYSNDVKSEALITIMRMLPGISGRQIRVYDDNPVEIVPYLQVARSLGAPNIEVIQVSHPDAKRKNFNPDGLVPAFEYQRRNTRFQAYSWRHALIDQE